MEIASREEHPKLYSYDSKGRIKQWQIGACLYEDGTAAMLSRAGLKDGALKDTKRAIKTGKNIGKANETSPHEQALKQAEAIAERKIREGYRLDGDEEAQEESREFSFNPLPTNFSPSKPIGDAPKDVSIEKGAEDYFAERKYNGVNLLLVIDEEGGKHTNTRGIKNITEIVKNVKPIQDFNKRCIHPNGSIVSYEFIYMDENGVEVPKMLRGIVNERTTSEKATARYDLLIDKGGQFDIKVFDVLFALRQDVTKKDYEDRRSMNQMWIWNDHPQYQPLFLHEYWSD